MAGEFTGLTHPVWGTPSGYSSPGNRTPLIQVAAGRRPGPKPPPLEQRLKDRTLLYGTPDQMIEQLKEVIQRNELGILCLWGNDGPRQPRRLQDLHPPHGRGGSSPPSATSATAGATTAPSTIDAPVSRRLQLTSPPR